MRLFLLLLVVLEGTALIASGGLLLLLEEPGREAPDVPVFKPPIYDARIGDQARYRKIDPGTKQVVGYLDYTVKLAQVFHNTSLGTVFRIEITERNVDGGVGRRRVQYFQPRGLGYGFLPPAIDRDERARVPGAQPVVESIRTAPVALPGGKEVAGFLVQAVIPRDGLTEIAERYWMTPLVPVFGVARFERGGFTYELHGSERPRPR